MQNLQNELPSGPEVYRAPAAVLMSRLRSPSAARHGRYIDRHERPVSRDLLPERAFRLVRP